MRCSVGTAQAWRGAGAEQLGQQFVCVNIHALAPGESSFPMTLVSLVLHLIFVWG